MVYCLQGGCYEIAQAFPRKIGKLSQLLRRRVRDTSPGRFTYAGEELSRTILIFAPFVADYLLCVVLRAS
jgi:hypothetical protein